MGISDRVFFFAQEQMFQMSSIETFAAQNRTFWCEVVEIFRPAPKRVQVSWKPFFCHTKLILAYCMTESRKSMVLDQKYEICVSGNV